MKPQNNDFKSYIYILYFQSNINFILYQIRLVFLIFEIKILPNGGLGTARGDTPALNVIAIRDQRHANVSKQRTLLANADVGPPHGSAAIT